LYFVTYMVLNTEDHPILSSPDGCCSITIHHTSSSSATVEYDSNTIGESFTMYVDTENQDPNITEAQQLRFEIQYAISEMQELCSHHHGS
jgi:hypothetical protein